MLIVPTLLCPKSWATMSGDETQRFCAYCKKHVHNLSALTLVERLALLSSPAASICSRYKVAVRRASKGKEKSYYRHLAKYGAGVALTGSVLLVLWEMNGRTQQERFYRTAAPDRNSYGTMPRDLYHEHELMLLGMIALPPTPDGVDNPDPPEADATPRPLDLKLDPVEIDRLIDQSLQLPPNRPAQNRSGGSLATGDEVAFKADR